MTLQYFTLVHILISLVGIAAGFGVLAGLLAGNLLRGWTTVFLVSTIATSVTGFCFPFHGFTPGIAVGILSLITLAVASYALYGGRLAGAWRATFVVTAMVSLYFNFFVLVVQLFQKVPALAELAPKQNEPPFAITQGLVLLTFIALTIMARRKFRGDVRQAV